MVASNGLVVVEVLVVSENLASWLWHTPLLGASRVGIFVSETAIWNIFGGGSETSDEIIRFGTLAITIHSVGTE